MTKKLSHPLADLVPICRTGTAIECAECRNPIFRHSVYFLSESDPSANHPFCWVCGMAVMLHLGQITPDDIGDYPMYGPI